MNKMIIFASIFFCGACQTTAHNSKIASAAGSSFVSNGNSCSCYVNGSTAIDCGVMQNEQAIPAKFDVICPYDGVNVCDFNTFRIFGPANYNFTMAVAPLG